MNRNNITRLVLSLTGIIALSVVLADCGGGGGGGGSAGGGFSISGTVSGATAQGVTMTLSGAGSGTAQTNAGGNYTFTGLANGGFTVTPAKSNFTFTPPSQAATVNGADVSGIDFTSVAAAQSVEAVACASVTADATVSAVGASGFSPATATISVNQVVKWNNSTGFNHTVTSDAGAWTSAALSNGSSVCLRFNVAGSYGYHCSPHPAMTGTVVVQ